MPLTFWGILLLTISRYDFF